jgi:NADH-quinone oxidoreductase subunit C
MDNSFVVETLRSQFGDAIRHVVEFRNQLIIWIAPERLVEICTFLRDDPRLRYNFLSDLAGLDRIGMTEESLSSGADPAQMHDALRFVVNYQLLSLPNKHRLWLKVGLPSSDPVVASVAGVWPTANFHEREVYDLFGIDFTGHPDLRRILMPEDWDGFPLRRDYPLGHEEVQFSHNFERIEKSKKYATR